MIPNLKVIMKKVKFVYTKINSARQFTLTAKTKDKLDGHAVFPICIIALEMKF